MSTTTLSLYEQLGADAAVNAAVDVFYRKVLTDDRVSRFFDGVDMDRQAAKQKAFLNMVFGGPATIPAGTCALPTSVLSIWV